MEQTLACRGERLRGASIDPSILESLSSSLLNCPCTSSQSIEPRRPQIELNQHKHTSTSPIIITLNPIIYTRRKAAVRNTGHSWINYASNRSCWRARLSAVISIHVRHVSTRHPQAPHSQSAILRIALLNPLPQRVPPAVTYPSSETPQSRTLIPSKSSGSLSICTLPPAGISGVNCPSRAYSIRHCLVRKASVKSLLSA
jgi:hypothetical protein